MMMMMVVTWYVARNGRRRDGMYTSLCARSDGPITRDSLVQNTCYSAVCCRSDERLQMVKREEEIETEGERRKGRKKEGGT